MRYAIVWSGRYGDEPSSEPSAYGAVGYISEDKTLPLRFKPPCRVEIDGDILQARFVAHRLSDWFDGQDGAYVVEGDDDE